MTVNPIEATKIPVTVKAVRFNLGEHTKQDWLQYVPEANIGAPTSQDDPEGMQSTDIRWFVIPTLEGHHEATDGDWLITGVNGEHYFCEPDVFFKTYTWEGKPLTFDPTVVR